MIKKMKPITMKGNTELNKEFGSQELTVAAPKSADPTHFPVFEVPVNKKVLVYVPNHTYQDENGVSHLKMDEPLIHYVLDGQRYHRFRCIRDIENEEYGLTGNCPLCDSTDDGWTLANYVIKSTCKTRGLDPDDKDNDQVKSIRTEAFSKRVVKEPTRYFTFPIVVIETVNDDGRTPIKNEDGTLKVTPMWYTISENYYETKWKKALEAMEDDPGHPGGHFFLLNYCYTPKRGEPNKRDSARELVVSGKSIKNSEKMRESLDKLTEEWTPDLAKDMVLANNVYNTEQLKEVADGVMEHTRNMIAVYEAAETTTQDSTGGISVGGAINPESLEDKSTPITPVDSDLDVE